MARLIAISGLAEKGPACFVVEHRGTRLLLDLGEGPEPGLLPDIAAIGRVDAVLLSHQHGDHIGALRFLPEIGNPPVFATAAVCRSIGKGVDARALPLSGGTEICGIGLRTGRSGHAPGGVWLHLAINDGLLYMGDWCVESLLYPFDPPPSAATLVTDVSYGDYDGPLTDCITALAEALGDGEGVILPLPAEGRGAELALHLARSGFVPVLDESVRGVIAALTGEDADCAMPDIEDELRRLLDMPEVERAGPAEPPRGVVLTAPATASGPIAQRAIKARREGAAISFILTGYVAPKTPAAELMKTKEARFVRWNIHPRLVDNAELVRAVGAETVLPAFGDKTFLPAWQKAFAPARTVIDRVCGF